MSSAQAEPSGRRSGPIPAAGSTAKVPGRFDWRINLVLFLATVASVGFTGYSRVARLTGTEAGWGAAAFAVPTLTILLAHEFGHYFAARWHRVPASLPYFLPAPVVSPFGTLGAVIVMPGRIRTSRALLDIGAAGPLAGIVVAVPTMVIGLSRSPIIQRSATGFDQEGQSLLYLLLKWLVVGPLRPDQDVLLHPTAFAAWFGFLITFLNLIPVGQLDGGHVAYALLGSRRHAQVARWAMFLPLLLIAVNLWLHGVPVLGDALGGHPAPNWRRLTTAVMPWVVIEILLVLLARFSGREHPPVDDPGLSPGRRRIAIFTMALFVLLFMPAPLVSY